jgi:hypothetical protein
MDAGRKKDLKAAWKQAEQQKVIDYSDSSG